MTGDVFTPEKRREVMGRIRPKDTGPERKIMGWLDAHGIRYVHQARIGGWTADFLLPDVGVVVEYRGCFWHLCPTCYPNGPSVGGGILGREWWARKLLGNRERDLRKEEELGRMGYSVWVIWGHEDLEARLEELEKMIRDEEKPRLRRRISSEKKE